MAITFKDNFTPGYLYFYDLSADTYTTRASTLDFFDDDSLAGDCVVIGSDGSYSNNGKFASVTFNVGTQVVATDLVVIWEYAKRGTGNYDPTWHALANVTDNTNGFQNAGSNIVTFDVPDDWENFFNPNGTTRWYTYWIRCRIVSITALTEGGQQTGSLVAQEQGILCAGYGSEAPVTMDDIYTADVAGGWGVVAKNSNLFEMNCNLRLASGCYFETINECVTLKNNFDMCCNVGVLLAGTQVSGDKVKDGTVFTFIQHNTRINMSIAGKNHKFYNTSFKHIRTGISSGHAASAIGSASGQEIYDVSLLGFRNQNFSYNSVGVVGVKCNSYTEVPGAIISKCTFFNTGQATRAGGATKHKTLHDCDVSNCTRASNPYGINTEDWDEIFVDCNFGIMTDANRTYWNSAGRTDMYIRFKFSVLIKLVDTLANVITGATITIKDKNGTIVFTGTSTADGYFGEDSGSVTSATSTVINDTNQTWTSNSELYKEIYITSGIGIGQRRIIKGGNTATQLPIVPSFDVTPDNTAKYIIIPYIEYGNNQPIATGNGYSIYNDSNPFTIEIKKVGYKTYKLEDITIKEKIDWTIAIQANIMRNPTMGGGMS